MRASVAERGTAGSTFDQVARAAGVSRGLLHYYFGTKERLLVEVVRRDCDVRMAALDEQLGQAQTADDFIAVLVGELEDVVRNDPGFVTLLFELFVLSRRHRDVAAEFSELLRRPRERRRQRASCTSRRRRTPSSTSSSRSRTGSGCGCSPRTATSGRRSRPASPACGRCWTIRRRGGSAAGVSAARVGADAGERHHRGRVGLGLAGKPRPACWARTDPVDFAFYEVGNSTGPGLRSRSGGTLSTLRSIRSETRQASGYAGDARDRRGSARPPHTSSVMQFVSPPAAGLTPSR
jgi:hypothetical protein